MVFGKVLLELCASAYLAMLVIFYIVVRYQLPALVVVEWLLMILTASMPIACGIFVYQEMSSWEGALKALGTLLVILLSAALFFYVTLFVVLNLRGS